MLVSVVVSLADQLSLGQFNIEVHAEEQSFGELFVALQAGMFDCVPDTSEMKELGHPSQQLCR